MAHAQKPDLSLGATDESI